MGVGAQRLDRGRLPLHLCVPKAVAPHVEAQINYSVGHTNVFSASEFGQALNGDNSSLLCPVTGGGESQPLGQPSPLESPKSRAVSALCTSAVQGAGGTVTSHVPCAAAECCASAPWYALWWQAQLWCSPRRRRRRRPTRPLQSRHHSTCKRPARNCSLILQVRDASAQTRGARVFSAAGQQTPRALAAPVQRRDG